MWVMTPYGYTSAVAHRTKPKYVLVRARDKQSLEYFCDFAGIKRKNIFTDFPSDYPYRAVVKRKQYDRFLLESAKDITYDNFKNKAKKVRGGVYVQVLMAIWTKTHELTPRDIMEKNKSSWDAYDRKHGIGKYAPKKNTTVPRTSQSIIASQWLRDDELEPEPDPISDEEAEAWEEWQELQRSTARKQSHHDLTEDEWRELMEGI